MGGPGQGAKRSLLEWKARGRALREAYYNERPGAGRERFYILKSTKWPEDFGQLGGGEGVGVVN